QLAVPLSRLHDLRVVPGADRVEAERERAVEHRSELDLLVAAWAGVWGATRRVLGNEVVDDVFAEALSQIPDIERDADHVRRSAGIPRVLEGAAAPRAGAERLGIAREREMDPHNVVPGLCRAGCSDGRIHAAGHRG